MKKTKILIVDDYPANITALSQLINGDESIEIFSATGAEQALAHLTEHEFALALIDVQMPQISGFELARLIRGVKRFRHLPIIFVTAHREETNFIFEGYETGAVDLLFKPLDPMVVRSKVRVFVQLDQQNKLLQDQVKELERLRVEAEAANLAKSRFLANMSHEIRTPLAAVLGFSEILTRGQYTPEEQAQCYSAIRRNGQLLLRLIDDLLDLSKIEAQKLEFENLEFSLPEILRDVDSTLTMKAAEKGLSLKIEIVPGVGTRYRSDPTRIKQVLLNVIGNAIKFTPQGQVEVSVSVENRQNDKETLRVLVKDSGIGLSGEQAKRLFQPFSQADASTRRQYGGSGLGLVISRQIAQGLGGDLRLLATEVGKGTTFEITFPLQNIETPSARSERKITMVGDKSSERSPLAGKRILAVDDSPDNLRLIELYLRSTGVFLTCVESGFEALEHFKTTSPDLILMDIQMPGMDGYQTTAQLRGLGYHEPILAITAHAGSAEHDRCIEAGCDDVLVKPVHRGTFLETVKKFMTDPGPTPAVEPVPLRSVGK